MPLPLVPLIAAGASLVGSGANAIAQGNQNEKNRDWQTWMWLLQQQANHQNWNMQNQYNEGLWNKQNQYNEQRWNIQNQYNEDMWNKQNQWNLDMWRRENEYNSPQAMMERYKAAGLNPNLIYGQSNMGGSISTANMDTDTMPTDPQQGNQRSSTSPPSYVGKAPQFDMNSGIMAFADTRLKQAQTNNLEAQLEVVKQEAALKAAQTANTVTQTAKTDFELNLASDLRATSMDAAKAALKKTQVETELSLNRDEREAALNSSNLYEAAHRIMKMRGEIISQEMDNKLKEMDMRLKSFGVTPGTGDWFNSLSRVLLQNSLNAYDYFKKK